MPLTGTTTRPEMRARSDGLGARMPLREHLRELRKRVVLAVAGLVVGAVVGWMLYPRVFDLLAGPVASARSKTGPARRSKTRG